MKASGTGTDERSALAAQGSVAGAGRATGAEGAAERPSTLGRRGARHARRRERRLQRLYALGGLLVLAAFLVATVVVVDMVR